MSRKIWKDKYGDFLATCASTFMFVNNSLICRVIFQGPPLRTKTHKGNIEIEKLEERTSLALQ
jgi:hypothetical protein